MSHINDKIVQVDSSQESAPKAKRVRKVRPEILKVKLTPSKQKDSKYTIKIEGGKTVHFG
jgi:hypothetical protein